MSAVVRAVKSIQTSFVALLRASPLYRWTTLISATLVLLTLALPLWRLIPYLESGQFIPLHYNIYFGVDRFGPWQGLFYLPALGFALLCINIVFEALFFRREHVLSGFFAVATVVTELILFTSMIFIVLLNI